MKVEYKNNAEIMFSKLALGDCFSSLDGDFIKIEEVRNCGGEVLANAINIQTGHTIIFDDKIDVFKLNATVVIGD